MGRLRFKLRKSKSGSKMHQHNNHTNHQQKQQQQQGKLMIAKSSESSHHHLPRIPYIRCGLLQGKTPRVLPESTKLPQSPVNKKSADISFPCPSTAPVASSARQSPAAPPTPAPKKWLTLGCDPCKQQRSLLHEDYKLRVIGSHSEKASGGTHQEAGKKRRVRVPKPQVTASPSQAVQVFAGATDAPGAPDEPWKQEMCWKVVARSMDNEFVRKRVILQRKKKSPSPTSSPPGGSEGVPHRSSEFESSTTAGGKTVMNYSSGFRSGVLPEAPAPTPVVYKLMTTSPDQSTENDSLYAWEKDLSPFASESSMFTSFDSPGVMNNSGCSSSSSSKISAASPESSRKSSSSRYVMKPPSPGERGRPGRRGSPELGWSPSPPLVPAHFEDIQNDPESSSKSWERLSPCPSPLNIDEEDRVPTPLRGPEAERGRRSRSRNEEDESKRGISSTNDKRKLEKLRGSGSLSFTSRVMESFAVEKNSVDPYRDFRESMIDMIIKKNLMHHSELEELLRSYLVLNKVEFHDVIVRVFTELWYQLFCYDSS